MHTDLVSGLAFIAAMPLKKAAVSAEARITFKSQEKYSDKKSTMYHSLWFLQNTVVYDTWQLFLHVLCAPTSYHVKISGMMRQMCTCVDKRVTSHAASFVDSENKRAVRPHVLWTTSRNKRLPLKLLIGCFDLSFCKPPETWNSLHNWTFMNYCHSPLYVYSWPAQFWHTAHVKITQSFWWAPSEITRGTLNWYIVHLT